MAYSQISIVTAVVAFVVLLVRILRIGRRPAGYPPGPPTVPLLGNIHLVSSSTQRRPILHGG
jgi:hypothetical protein